LAIACNVNVIKLKALSKQVTNMTQHLRPSLQLFIPLFSCLIPLSVQAQITPDGTLPDDSVVTTEGDTIQIGGGTTRGDNLFHSFQDFSVPNGQEAAFNNADTIENIFSRVTGGNESLINGGISANGSANVFLINPAGIIFGENAFLDVDGSFIGSTADSLLFPDDIEFSATNTDNTPVLTINAPIGLGFRDAPQPISNSSLNGSQFDSDNLVGLSVPKDETLALIGGDISLPGGIMSSEGGRIELGSVGANSTVSLTKVDQGWDVGYEGVENFQDLDLTEAAFIESRGANTGDIEVQARNISLVEGSQIAINTSAGKAGNLRVVGTESLSISGNGEDIDEDQFASLIFNEVEESASGADSALTVTTNRLTLDRGGQITAITSGSGQGVDIDVNATEISIGKPFVSAVDGPVFSAIFAQTDEDSTGDGGNISIETTSLNLNDGGQVNAETSGSGNGGNLQINASESIDLTGTVPKSASTELNPSALFTSIAKDVSTATGNSGNLSINTSALTVTDGAQISTSAQNQGNGGILTINATESIFFSGFVNAEGGNSGIFISAEPSFEDESGKVIPTTGNGGTLNLTTGELIIERGGAISAETYSLGDAGDANLNVNRLIVRDGGEIRIGSLLRDRNSPNSPLDTERGDGGTLNINAKESVEITGARNINGKRVQSSLSAKGESNGNAGNIFLKSQSLEVSNDGLISAATAAGSGGNITLQVDNSIRLQNDSLISAAATGKANGGNINLNTTFVIAGPKGNNDIVANAGEQGTGGRIEIDAESVLGIKVRPQNDQTNDLDATGGVDGEVIINTPDTNTTQAVLETPENIVEVERMVSQVCRNDDAGTVGNNLVVNGKGGVTPEPSAPLNSDNLVGDDRVATESTFQPLQTASGVIIPARGIIRTPSGKIVLTPYPTDNNQRVFPGKVNCG
jgi:filamentous hemagglutinin family protein